MQSKDTHFVSKGAINHNLENQIKQLFDYWFTQYDFPDKNGMPYKSSGGRMVLNDEIKMVIPEGWSISNLDAIMKVRNNKVLPTSLKPNSKYTPIDVIPRRRISFHETAPLDEAISGLCSYQKGDILLSNRRVYFHKVCLAPFDGITRDTVIILEPKSDISGYAYQIVNTDAFIDYATRHSYGSEQPVLSWESAKKYMFAFPNSDLACKYSMTVQPILEKILSSQLKIRKLISIKESVLPLLISGQVIPKVF